MNGARVQVLLIAAALCAGGCSGKGTVTPMPEEGACLGSATADLSKIHHWAAISTNSTAQYPVSVMMKRTRGACGEGEASCLLSEEELLSVQQTNQKDVQCLVGSLERGGKLPVVAPIWYDVAGSLASGRPVPLGRAFAFTGSVEDLRKLSASSLVEAIDPAPGQAAGVPLSAPLEPAGCPTDAEGIGEKLADAMTLQGNGRQPVVVQLRDAGVLPEPVTCEAEANCEAGVTRLWERTIMNTRELTCVRRWIDTKLREIPVPVDYSSGTGSATAPVLPPFGQAAGTVSAQAMLLNWDEAVLVAGSVYVDKIWTSSGLMPPGEVSPTCPPDPHAVIVEPTCTSARESIAGKIDSNSQTTFEAAMGSPVQVMIRVKGGAEICPLDSCGEKSCPAAEEIQQFWAQQNRASQKCVRDLVGTLGGDISSDVFWLVNSFVATLTWPQIQTVATHPDVLHIDPNAQ